MEITWKTNGGYGKWPEKIEILSIIWDGITMLLKKLFIQKLVYNFNSISYKFVCRIKK